MNSLADQPRISFGLSRRSWRVCLLITRNGHFHRLNREYYRMNRQIHNIEAQQRNLEDEVPEYLKRKRLALKAELLIMLQGV